jgi:hypothetical protein
MSRKEPLPMPPFRLSLLPPRAPLSGDVTQTINPWTWMTQIVGNQFGLNINLGQSSEPALERLILDEVGSYGRQLGRIGDALLPLIKKARDPSYTLTEDDERALNHLVVQLEQVEAVKDRFARDRARG